MSNISNGAPDAIDDTGAPGPGTLNAVPPEPACESVVPPPPPPPVAPVVP